MSFFDETNTRKYFDTGIIHEDFGEDAYIWFRDFPDSIAIWYDEPPLSEWLHRALMEDVIHIALDYDRVGRSKTGYVYRIAGRNALIDHPGFSRIIQKPEKSPSLLNRIVKRLNRAED